MSAKAGSGGGYPLRFLQLVDFSHPVDLYLSSHPPTPPAVTNLAAGEITGYLTAHPHASTLTVTRTGSPTPLVYSLSNLPASPALVVIPPATRSSVPLVFPDKQRCPIPGKANLRVINATRAPLPIQLDVGSYGLVPPLDTAGSPYIRVPLGAHTISVVDGGEVAELFFVSGAIYTLIILGVDSKGNWQISFCQDNTPSDCEKIQPGLSLASFMGNWYQVASIRGPLPEAPGRVTYTYTHLNEGVKILCSNLGMTEGDLVGFGLIPRPEQPAIWAVSYGEAGPPEGPNWLIHLLVPHSHALVGSPDRSSLLILSRTKVLSAEVFGYLIDQAGNLGYTLEEILLDTGAVA